MTRNNSELFSGGKVGSDLTRASLNRFEKAVSVAGKTTSRSKQQMSAIEAASANAAAAFQRGSSSAGSGFNSTRECQW
jgi:hypothetical protein